MAPNPKREALIVETERLRKQSQKFLANGVFGGWTHEEKAVHEKRTARITELIRALEALNGER